MERKEKIGGRKKGGKKEKGSKVGVKKRENKDRNGNSQDRTHQQAANPNTHVKKLLNREDAQMVRKLGVRRAGMLRVRSRSSNTQFWHAPQTCHAHDVFALRRYFAVAVSPRKKEEE